MLTVSTTKREKMVGGEENKRHHGSSSKASVVRRCAPSGTRACKANGVDNVAGEALTVVLEVAR